jgi:hypothetical protein
VTPNQGPVSVYNNVVYNAGKGPTNSDGGGVFSCINVQYTGDETTSGPNGAGAGTVEVFNNTTYSCGTNPDSSEAGAEEDLISNCDASNPNIFMHIRNNLAYSVETSVWPSGVPYFAFTCNSAAQLYGVNNLAYGAGAAPASLYITGTVNSNPQVVSTSTPDLHLASASGPAVGAGVAISVTPYGVNWTGRDRDGLIRPSPPSIGAYEYASGGIPIKPSPPTDLTVVSY